MNMESSVEELYNLVGPSGVLTVSRHETDRTNGKKYWVSIGHEKSVGINIMGYVDAIYGDTIVYSMSQIPKQEGIMLDDSTVKRVMELALEISMNSPALDGYAIKIFKDSSDRFIMEVPEFTTHRYSPSYFTREER